MITAEELMDQIHNLRIGQRLCIPNVPERMYHESEGIGSTLLKAAVSSLHHYKATLNKTFKGTTTTRIGSATHALVLEPEKFEDKFHVLKKGENRTEAVVKEVKEASPYKDVLNDTETNAADVLACEVLDQCGKMFIDGQPELSYWYRHETGIILKARVDYQKDDYGLDLKTGKFSDESKFIQTMKYEYCIQDQLYLMVTGLVEFAFVGVSKSDHHDCYYGILGPNIRAKSKRIIEKTIREIAFAHEHDDFPRRELKLSTVELTAYEQKQEEAA